jgi:adenylate kinase
VPQAEALDELVAETGRQMPVALVLLVPAEEVMKRLTGRRVCPSCGRSYHIQYVPPAVSGVCDNCGASLVQRDDDTPETVSRRLEVYEAETVPVIDYYRAVGRVTEVDGQGSPAEVGRRLHAAVAPGAG